jgi:hypothetical protein
MGPQQVKHYTLNCKQLTCAFEVSFEYQCVVSWVAVENPGLLQRLTGSRYLLIVFVSLA